MADPYKEQLPELKQHTENSDVLIRVQSALKNITTFLKMKMFLLCLNQDGIYIVYLNNKT